MPSSELARLWHRVKWHMWFCAGFASLHIFFLTSSWSRGILPSSHDDGEPPSFSAFSASPIGILPNATSFYAQVRGLQAFSDTYRIDCRATFYIDLIGAIIGPLLIGVWFLLEQLRPSTSLRPITERYLQNILKSGTAILLLLGITTSLLTLGTWLHCNALVGGSVTWVFVMNLLTLGLGPLVWTYADWRKCTRRETLDLGEHHHAYGL